MLTNNGFKIDYVDDGEDEVVESPVDTICSVDESWPHVSKGGEEFGMFIVLGNADCEIVCDYTSRNTDLSKEFGMIIDGHSDLYS